MDYNEMKERVQAQVESHRHDLIDLSMKIPCKKTGTPGVFDTK